MSVNETLLLSRRCQKGVKKKSDDLESVCCKIEIDFLCSKQANYFRTYQTFALKFLNQLLRIVLKIAFPLFWSSAAVSLEFCQQPQFHSLLLSGDDWRHAKFSKFLFILALEREFCKRYMWYWYFKRDIETSKSVKT